jgi:protein required for attachment to host cells
MARDGNTYAKRQREAQKRQKAEEKRQKREQRSSEPGTPENPQETLAVELIDGELP